MKARKVPKLDPARPLAENAARIVEVRLDELRGFVPRALKPERKRAQHDMRIAAKRLRYVLEVTGPCFGKPAEEARRRARDLQDHLGAIHDCDVMLPRVERHLDRLRDADARALRERGGGAQDLDATLAARAPNRTAYRGLDTLGVYIRARRELLFDRFTEFWAEQERLGTWTKLEDAAAQTLERAREARRKERAAVKARQRADAAARERARAEAREREALQAREQAEREAEDAEAQAQEAGEEVTPNAEAEDASAPAPGRPEPESGRPGVASNA